MDQLNLNKEQLSAIKHGKGPLLIIAGAGTGKTTVITERIKRLILEEKVEPSQILALTFTEKAAIEMEERVDKVMPYGYTQMWISTFHSFCDRILRQEAIHTGINPSYKLMTEAETILFIRKNLFKFNLNYFRPLGNPTKFISALVQHFSRLKDEDITNKDYQILVKKLANKLKKSEEGKMEVLKLKELADAYAKYQEIKKIEGVMDFSDLIGETLNLFRKRPNILKHYQDHFKYILLDEFQDTNFAQNELAILLANKTKNITVVGDDDQSIYRFRGSSISNILQFKDKFPTAKVVTLTQNYRSTKNILDSSYTLIQFNNPDRLEVKKKINKKLNSARNIQGDKVEFIYLDRVENEADFIAGEIRKIKRGGKYNYNDFAILVRANDYSLPFIKALERKGIPFQFLGPGKLFHQEEIKDLIAYLKVLYNFEDSTSLYRILNMAIFDFDAIEIASLLNFAKKNCYSLFETLEKVNQTFLKEDSKKRIEEIVKMIHKHLKLVPKETAGQILYYFLQDSGLLKSLLNSKNQKEETIARNIAKFFDKLKTYEVDHDTATVFDLVDWIDLSMQMGESPLASDSDWTENDAVNILTVHSSKGLEFPVVFIVSLVAQRFPTRERKDTIPIPQEFIKEILPTGDYHLEEERRLFYVAMTRAKDKLYLTASNYYGEGKRERKISPFVFEAIGKEKVESVISSTKNGQLSLIDLESFNFNPQDPVQKPQNAINYLSYSQIQTFEICPLHYKLKYILKLPTPPTSAQSFGTTIHAVLRDLHQIDLRGEKINLAKIFDLLEKNWVNIGYDSKSHQEKALESAKNIITTYFENEYKKRLSPIALELPFTFNLKGIKVGGRIDRIDKINENNIEIIDYKTGNNIRTEKELSNDFQLSIYALAAREIQDKIFNKKPENIKLSLYYLESGQKISTFRTNDQLEEAKIRILKAAETISASDFSCSENIFCKSCEYKMLCSTKN